MGVEAMAIEQFDEAILAFAQVYLELERVLDRLPSFNQFHRRRRFTLHMTY